MHTSKLLVAFVFVSQHSVASVLFADTLENRSQDFNVIFQFLRCRRFGQFFLFKQPFQFLIEGNIDRVFVIEVLLHRLTSFTDLLFVILHQAKGQFLLAHLAEGEHDFLKCHIENVRVIFGIF
ncbi:hypothetical protein BK147_30890 [Paenibacillus sp. FSL R7-0337]|nr:hypothetical protein BK147_30890 [Paenibacillus sp. FSL R7-0337]